MVSKNRKNGKNDVPYTENEPFTQENNIAMQKAMDIAESFRRGSPRFDPFGTWTGVPENGNDRPVQDADDL